MPATSVGTNWPLVKRGPWLLLVRLRRARAHQTLLVPVVHPRELTAEHDVVVVAGNRPCRLALTGEVALGENWQPVDHRRCLAMRAARLQNRARGSQ